MPREISIFGVLAPSLLLVFLLSVVIHIGVDWLCGHFDIYKHVWHRSLFRLCLLVCIFGALALIIY
ncbi:efflux system membrane protein [compost metagenome]